MTKQVGIGISVVAVLVVGAVWWLTLPTDSDQQNGAATVPSTEPQPNVSAQDVDSDIAPQPTSSPAPTTQPPAVTRSSGLVHDPENRGTPYANAIVEAATLINRFGPGVTVLRSRVVEIDKVYAARLIADLLRGTDALSETFDVTIFPDTPCTLSYVESMIAAPKYRSIETGPGRTALVEDEAGGKEVIVNSRCASNSETIGAQIHIDTTVGSVRIQLSNGRLTQQLVPLDTDGFVVAIDIDPKSFPRDEHR